MGTSEFEGRMARRRHELLEDLSLFSAGQLIEHGLPDNTATLIGNALADHVADRWGGQMLSFPKDHKRKLHEQDLAIYRKFNGGNYAELALEYKMSERGIRKVIARIVERLRRQNADAQLTIDL